MKTLILILLFTALQIFAQSSEMLLLFSDAKYPFINSEAEGWYDRVTANSGSVSDATNEAIDSFFIMLDDSSARSWFIRTNLFVGDDTGAVFIPQIVSVSEGSATLGNDIDINVNFVPGDYTEAGGLGDGSNSTKYLKTGVIPSAVSEIGQNDAHISFYCLTNDNSSSTITMGVNTTNILYWLFLGANAQARLNSTGGTSQATGGSAGYFIGTRVLSTTQIKYKNGASIGTETRASTAEPTKELYVMASNGNGSPASYEVRFLAGYTIGTGLTPTQVVTLNNIMEWFQDKIGRGVVP